jgi:hypothetical protein
MAFRPQGDGSARFCIKLARSALLASAYSYFLYSKHPRHLCKKVIGFEIFKGFMPPNNCNTVCPWFAPAGPMAVFLLYFSTLSIAP